MLWEQTNLFMDYFSSFYPGIHTSFMHRFRVKKIKLAGLLERPLI